MEIYCIHCGTKLPDIAKFCLNCGKPPRGDSAVPTTGYYDDPENVDARSREEARRHKHLAIDPEIVERTIREEPPQNISTTPVIRTPKVEYKQVSLNVH